MIKTPQIHRFERRKGIHFDENDYDVVDYYLGGFNGGVQNKDFEIYTQDKKLDSEKLNRIFSYRSKDGRRTLLGRGTFNYQDTKTVSHILSKIEKKEEIALACLVSEDSTIYFKDYEKRGKFKDYKGKKMNRKEIETNHTFLESIVALSTVLKKIYDPFNDIKENWSIFLENETPKENIAIGSIYTLPFSDEGRVTDSIIVAQGKNSKRVVEGITQTKSDDYDKTKKWKEISYFAREGIPLIENASPETTLRVAMASAVAYGPLFDGYTQLTLGKYKIEKKPDSKFCLYERG